MNRGGFAVCRFGTEISTGIQWAIKVINLKALSLSDVRCLFIDSILSVSDGRDVYCVEPLDVGK